ncbi:hypothetical protein B0F90DRAFT_1753303 [Multifurca ochricompacta]|uniref:Uncharacterized protein n=1 Tax=Multifurca ochricompacta TaxID=376703 RepID=A0AAD4LYC9_9AGAM|nr:hypothetical protein B0F90DRAFT_1753303 [Multifurca ochricompacta]
MCVQIRAAHNGTAAFRTVASLPTFSVTSSTPGPDTHYRITLRCSGISLGRLTTQTVCHLHTPETAGMILASRSRQRANVPASVVQTVGQQRAGRKAPRGLTVVVMKIETGNAGHH